MFINYWVQIMNQTVFIQFHGLGSNYFFKLISKGEYSKIVCHWHSVNWAWVENDGRQCLRGQFSPDIPF